MSSQSLDSRAGRVGLSVNTGSSVYRCLSPRGAGILGLLFAAAVILGCGIIDGTSPSSDEASSSSGAASSQPDAGPPAGRKFGMAWWHWALAGGGALIVVGVVVAVVPGVFGPSGPPIGREVARHTHKGVEYALVEYGDELAIFSGTGAPVSQRGLAEDILRSYVWRQVVEEFDVEELEEVSGKAQTLDESVSDARRLSNDVVAIFDGLEGMKANIPFVGSISAMDVVTDSFSGMGEAEEVIRSLDSELNDLGDDALSLTRTAERIREAEPSSVSGEEMESLFVEAVGAVENLEGTVRAVKEFMSGARESVGGLAGALRSGRDTPVIGEALGDFERSAGRFESELSGLTSLLGGFESELGALEDDMRAALKSADETIDADMGRWLAEPYDAEWPLSDSERRPAGVAPPREERQAPAPAPVTERTPFKLPTRRCRCTPRWSAGNGVRPCTSACHGW